MPEISDIELTRMKRAVEELSVLNKIAIATNISMPLEKITQITLDHCLKHVHTTQGAVYLLKSEDKADDKAVTFVRRNDPTITELPFHVDVTLTGWMIKNRTIFISNSPDTDDRIKGIDLAPLGIRSILAAPLLSQKGLLGLLVLVNKNDSNGFNDNDKRFLAIVAAQSAKIIENARLFEKELQLRDIQIEIDLARKIQEGFLPKGNILDPGFEIFGFNSAAKQVGGDFYDMIRLKDNSILLSLGDVSGKGIPAALLMSNAQAVIRSHAGSSDSADLVNLIESLNRLICQFTQPGQYITMILGCFEPALGKYRYANAGHPSVIVVRKDSSLELHTDSDLVVGVLPGFSYHEHQISLSSGDTLFLFTDGITECFNSLEEQFGDDSLAAALISNSHLPARDICQAVLARMNDFRKDTEQSDDITMLALKVR
ncbi:MAG: GAF domain-containing SpoIIE family protein phosphatase [candidate division Zixibacteria bacterium]|nr:GAF domain-containing SpoIIE family protein phosphatase [candidate division Zixibacteria bacterium]